MRKNIQSIYILLCVLFALSGCSNLPAEHTVVSPRSGEIRLPVKEMRDGTVHFFTYKKDGKRINFFIRTDGRITFRPISTHATLAINTKRATARRAPTSFATNAT
jgi:hypothetical protein